MRLVRNLGWNVNEVNQIWNDFIVSRQVSPFSIFKNRRWFVLLVKLSKQKRIEGEKSGSDRLYITTYNFMQILHQLLTTNFMMNPDGEYLKKR